MMIIKYVKRYKMLVAATQVVVAWFIKACKVLVIKKLHQITLLALS